MIEFQENISLKTYSNYRIGGAARYFYEAKTEEQLQEAVRTAREKKIPLFLLGGGTNILISDAGFPGLVLKISFDEEMRAEGTRLAAHAGVLMRDVLQLATEKALGGLEWAGGLPGTVGGAVRGNAGAFGGEIKDNIFSVRSYDSEADARIERSASECEFGYRDSIFKKRGNEIITRVVFELIPQNPTVIAERVDEKIHFRKEKHPLEYPNIGSIFKNVPVEHFSRNYAERTRTDEEKETNEAEIRAKFPVKDDPFPVVPTAYLISEVGLKGLAHGGAQISEKHPNFIVNRGDATAANVEELIALIKKSVLEKFGVELEEEVQRVGE